MHKVLVKLVLFCTSSGDCLARVVGETGWCIKVAYVFFVGQFCSARVEDECEVSGWQGCGSGGGAGGCAGSAGGWGSLALLLGGEVATVYSILEPWKVRALESVLGTGSELAFARVGGLLAPDLGSICGD